MSDITLTRLPGYDVNGNPRYVCHYANLLTWNEIANLPQSEKYPRAVTRSHKIGGRKYHNKRYGGGIVFTDYESNLRAAIARLVTEAEAQEGAG